MKKWQIILCIVLSMIAGCMVGTSATMKAIRKNVEIIPGERFNSSKLGTIWGLVDRHYVDPVDGDSVMDKVYASILSTLDPHSVYLTQTALEKESEVLSGNFEGVGIVLRIIDDTVSAAQIIAGGPSERAGILAGDRILKVDNEPVSGVKMPSDSVVARLRGPRRSTVEIEILRLSEKSSRTVKVQRDVISTPSLTYSGMLNASTGYIRLNRFGETTYEEFCEALKKLNKKGMKRLILDLRGNGGGMLSAAIDICDELLPGKETIVYTEGAHQRRKNAYSTPGGLFCRGDLTVLIDEQSASASEIVAGAMQDNDRGLIVGRRTFGKGLVQQQFPLPDHTAVLLTIARYYTPSGRCIQRPYDNGTEEYYSQYMEQVLDEYNGDTVQQISDSTPYYTTKGRVVYGGGGIMPDHVIHYKSDPDIVYYNQLLSKGILDRYTFNYVSANNQQLRDKYPTADDFNRNFTISDAMMQELFDQAEAKGLRRDNRSIQRYKQEIRAQIKAGIGNMFYGNDVLYKLLLPYDNELKEALETKK